MSDLLAEIGANKGARPVIQALGLPLPMPQKLARAKGPYAGQPLDGKAVVVGVVAVGTYTVICFRSGVRDADLLLRPARRLIWR